MLKKLFKKNNKSNAPKGFETLTISNLVKLSNDTVKVELDVPANLMSDFKFTPGQYLNFAITIDGKEERRSYSICSGENEPLAVAVKQIENGKVSTWFNNTVQVGDPIFTSQPEGNFTLSNSEKNIVAIAAGSGITPILSIAKSIEESGESIRLFYGNRTQADILFKSEIDGLSKTKVDYYLSQETADGFGKGRFDKTALIDKIKEDLSILKSDGFYLCGPEQLIMDANDALKMFGVDEEKIHFELFTTPVLMKPTAEPVESDFNGVSHVKVIIDDEELEFDLSSDGKNILDTVNSEGFDAPYSCKGGVCCTCKAKVLEGKATMTLNYSLTDSEVEEGYILTCQSHPASENLIVSYDE